MDTLQERKFEGARAAYLSMPKVSQQGKLLSWLHMELFPGTQGKKKVHHLWIEGKATQKVFKDVVRSCSKKSTQVKAPLELNLAASVKIMKKIFFLINKKKEENQMLPFAQHGNESQDDFRKVLI